MSFQKFLENKLQPVTTSLGKYPEIIQDFAYELAHWSGQQAARIKRYSIDIQKLEALLGNLHYPQTQAMLTVVAARNPQKITAMQQHFRMWWRQTDDAAEKNLRAAMKTNFDPQKRAAQSDLRSQAHEVSSILGDYLSHLYDHGHQFTDDVAEQTAKNLIAEAERFVQSVAQKIQTAISSIQWNGTPVSVQPMTPSKETWTEPTTAAEVHVGKAEFVYFEENGKVEIDDVLDAGDEDFFTDGKSETDYFNLVRELQNPGSTSKPGKLIVVYTARPSHDREVYEKAQQDISLGQVATIPPRIFVTSRADSAVGLGVDLSGERDIWKIRIDSRHLMKTVDTGREQQYQVIGDEPVPIRWIELYQKGDE